MATGDADHECGSAGPFLLDVGIFSSFHIAEFFGIAPGISLPAKTAARSMDSRAPRQNNGFSDDNTSVGAGLIGKTGSRNHIGEIISGALAKAGLLTRR